MTSENNQSSTPKVVNTADDDNNLIVTKNERSVPSFIDRNHEGIKHRNKSSYTTINKLS